MKKFLGMLFCLICLIGCSNNEVTYYDIYLNIRDQLVNQTVYDTEYEFDIQVVYNKMDDQYRYDVIIDEPSESMYNVVVLSYVDENDDEMCPNIGIFDYDTYHLAPHYINKEENFYKGIQVSGMCDNNEIVLVYVSYYTDETLSNKVEKYIEVINSEIG